MITPSAQEGRTVLLTGATGFVGRNAYPALCAAGYRVICASRDPDRARAEAPDREWVKLDVDVPETFCALHGCDAVLYLVHHMGGGPGYAEREAQAADALREAATTHGVGRIVYLGGVAPVGQRSAHLESRLQTGLRLRQAGVPTIELRAAMIVGEGSTSWQIVRDLAARLPAMLLPRWLNNGSCPVSIDDVVAALLWGLSGAPPKSAWYNVPGPEVLSHRELITRVAHVLGNRPTMIEVPVVTPLLSSYWIALVTRIDLDMARELVQGLQSDLVPQGPSVWDYLPDHTPLDLDTAARNALADEAFDDMPAPPTLARLRTLGQLLTDRPVV